MTQKELNIINDILSKLVIPEEFGDYEEGDDGYFLGSVIDQCNELGLKWDNGASKFVIFPNDCNYVIKIPMNGMWYFSEDYDEELDEYVDGEDYFEEFSGAYGNGWDYCNAEVLAYKDACEAGFEDFLAETKYIGTTSDGTPAYVQEKVNVSWSYENKKGSKTPSPESFSRAEEIWEKKIKRFANKYWLGLAIDEKTEERVEAFIEFAKNHDCIGADMHGHNFGYREDGSVVLLDYSGFWS